MRDIIIVIYRTSDPYQLPVAIRDTIEDASAFIGCHVSSLYENFHKHGVMKAKGYSLDIVDVTNV